MIPSRYGLVQNFHSKPRASGDDPSCTLYGRTDLLAVSKPRASGDDPWTPSPPVRIDE